MHFPRRFVHVEPTSNISQSIACEYIHTALPTIDIISVLQRYSHSHVMFF